MVNPYRGEVSLTVNGEELPLRLTLGALAELEARLETGSLLELIERFESGDFKTLDLIALLAAGLRGAGWQGGQDDLLTSTIAGGPVVAAQTAGQLLKLTFSLPE
jgi:Phage tail tube protein, GTA-gp10